MRVLMTADSAGGVWTYALELARALAPRGVTTTLAVTGPPLRPDQRRELEDAGVAAFTRGVKLEWMSEPWEDVDEAGTWLLRLRDVVQPDVVHLNSYAFGTLPWEAPLLVAGHSCVLSWFRAVRGEQAPREWDEYAARVHAGIAAADVLVTPTRAFLAELRRLYRPRCASLVVANGRRALAPRTAKEPLVLGAGRLWDEAKNAAALDRVAPSLQWPVLLAGAFADEARPRHAQALGTLPSSTLWGYLSRASIFAAPALYEPFGYGPLEAALAGCALVLGDIASLREVWGDAALYVDPRDDDAIATALRLLIEEDALRRELAARATERAHTYTPERMAAAYHDAYTWLLEEAPAEEAV